ncbi:hypothetical protein BDV93DRAFT_516536 [Ceratobasidium sp. AG-I]|nr:hypothetical protein BDV93DRAFT_516536 [Ceratobasidium sp. AG-I]
MASPLGFPSSDDEVTAVPRGRVAVPRQPDMAGPHNQRRANSSPLAAHMRVYQDRSATPYAPPSTRDPSPTPTEDTQGGSTYSSHSELDSNITEGGATKHSNKTALKRSFIVPKLELKQLIERVQNSDSKVYQNYHELTVVYKATGHLTHNGFKCKHCNQVVERLIGMSYTLNLTSHSKKCTGTTKQSQSLDVFGITGGSLHTLAEEQLQKLLHPDTRKHQPHRDTIRKDIRRIYQATQGEIANMLEKQLRIFHLTLDLSRAATGWTSLPATVERFMLACISHLVIYSNSYIEINLLFRMKRERLEKIIPSTDGDDDYDIMSRYLQDDPDVDLNDNGLDASQMLEPLSEDDEIFVEIDIPPMEKGSPREVEQSHVAKTLYKAAKLAHRLRYTPAARVEFKHICVELDVDTPHNVKRDVHIWKTRPEKK